MGEKAKFQIARPRGTHTAERVGSYSYAAGGERLYGEEGEFSRRVLLSALLLFVHKCINESRSRVSKHALKGTPRGRV
jgi:hypothetical protein